MPFDIRLPIVRNLPSRGKDRAVIFVNLCKLGGGGGVAVVKIKVMNNTTKEIDYSKIIVAYLAKEISKDRVFEQSSSFFRTWFEG
jgi:hypothetical protein